MDKQQASDLKYGDKVFYLDTPAIVQRVSKAGVTISYDGKGIRQGQYVTERVSARYLEHRK